MTNIDGYNQEVEKQNEDRKFIENMKQLEEQARIEGIKLRIKEEIRVLEERKKRVKIQCSKLSDSAIKEKKELYGFIAQFDLEINELNKKLQLYN